MPNSAPNITRLTVEIDKELKQQAKLMAAYEHKTLAAFVTDLLCAYIAEHNAETDTTSEALQVKERTPIYAKTNIMTDTAQQELMQQVRQYTGIDDQNELLQFILRDFIEQRTSRNLLDLFGNGGIHAEYDHKKLRAGTA